jgi:7,8-dihydropterin-6-yl-methyl-4-(beta-D-ribofuranosyl)aminobenzene 5'-phosphate synthase
MKITCLVDNCASASSQLWGEHGLAFLVETDAGRLLFDTGQSGTVLLHNVDVLGLPVESFDALALSHAHYDHSGGLPQVLDRVRSGIPMYANPDLFRERFRAVEGDAPKSIGLPLSRRAVAERVELRLSAEPQEVLPGVWTTGVIDERPEPEGRGRAHRVREDEDWIPDPYRDDMALVVEWGDGTLLLVCGCCHAGLLNTLAHARRVFGRPVSGVVGGAHLMGAGDGTLRRVRRVLADLPALRALYLGHCTGRRALNDLATALGTERVRPCPAGRTLCEEDLT